jgi:hypothetical protein
MSDESDEGVGVIAQLRKWADHIESLPHADVLGRRFAGHPYTPRAS